VIPLGSPPPPSPPPQTKKPNQENYSLHLKENPLCFVIYIREKIKAIERRITKCYDPSQPPSSASKTLFSPRNLNSF